MTHFEAVCREQPTTSAAAVIVSPVAIIYLGLEGAALGTAIALITWNILLVIIVRRRLNIEPMAIVRYHKGVPNADQR